MKHSRIQTTIAYLKQCQSFRASGTRVSYTTDPSWLVHMAINRRAGWQDDPTEYRGSCMPVNGRYPKKAEGRRYWELKRLAYSVNSRVAIHWSELGEWRRLIALRLPWRIFEVREDFSVLLEWAYRNLRGV